MSSAEKVEKAGREDFITFKDTGKRTEHYNLRVFTHRGKTYVDVTPLYIDMGKNYEVANYFREMNGNLKTIKQL